MQRPKNVIWIVTDQMRAQTTGYAGDPNVSTPNLDRLAAEGVNFTRAVAGTPLCCPFRGAMVTGRYPHNNGVTGHRVPMPDGTRTVAHTFADAGYATCYIGKWHLDGDRPELGDAVEGEQHHRVRMIPTERRAGFQDWWAYENNNRPFDCLVHTDEGRTPSGMQVLRAADGMEQFRLPGYEADALTDILLGWLDGRAGTEQPFFAVLSMQPPHNPYTAPASAMARHMPGDVRLRPNVPDIAKITERARRDLAGYYAAIEQIDHNIGRIRSRLHGLGLEEDTYLVFFSDHGDLHGSHGQWRKTAPWEEAVRIPFLVGGPSREHQDTCRLDAPLNHVDIAPTTLGLCGLSVPAEMEGIDYSRVIDGAGGPSSPTDYPESAYLSLPLPTGHPSSVDLPWRGVVTRDGWKYVRLDGRPWLMFNLNDDPYEWVNLAHDPAHHAERTELELLLREWSLHTGDRSALARETIHRGQGG
ncbi:sulfatase family protein [Phytoactinopolyspora halotolerans]|uniref:Sulfatase n=1 Tax=Phytoactinopolyspora halotolerans TaxID=1981512 RepID=A0A6L9S361_9ACTN|nr:sulfatase [Phytoactinopolyspora halotolerans]NED99496.1 sulfatase [Phytoactinopolyspora halotolerans]